MNDVNIGKDNSRHSFVFTGKGGEYFLISLDLRYSLYGSEESAVSGEHDLTE